MKENPDMRLFFICGLFFCYTISQAQLRQVSIVQQPTSQKRNLSARVQSLSAMKLPFWDDFSFNNSPKNYPHDSLWQYGHSVWVNTGMGINPPTLKVATFDGIDSLGKPYNITNALAKGVADKLISRPIRMDLVNPSDQDSVFIFFYYQYQGNGEAPDPQDEFSLWFKQDSTAWKKVWAVQYDTLKDKTKFVRVKIYIQPNCSTCFHNDFQFRFQNFARLSGPFDTWNLDYVYVSNGKSLYPIIDKDGPHYYKDFGDRAIATPLTSVLKQYHSIPAKHLLAKPDTALNYMTITCTNQRADQVDGQRGAQPVPLISHLTITHRLNKIVTRQPTIPFDNLPTPNPGIFYGIPSTYVFDRWPDLSLLDPKTDSIALKFHVLIGSGDHKNKVSYDSLDVNGNLFKDSLGNSIRVVKGDYDTTAYRPIEFRYNDTTSTNFIFSNYYAYDDGIAEYAASLTQTGNYLAYQFDMMYSKADTLVAVDIYFPHVGDETNQVLQLTILDNQVLDATTTNPVPLTTPQDLTVVRTEDNKFTRVPLAEAVVVSKKFFISYKQNSNTVIGVGLDKNSDSGGKIFANLGTGWVPADLHGNLMIRPVFGNPAKAKGPLTAVEGKKLYAYPNPNHGVFYIPQRAQGLQVFDVAGRSISFVQEGSLESTQITLANRGVAQKKSWCCRSRCWYD